MNKKTNIVDRLILKLNEKFDLYKQTIYSSLFFSLCFNSLLSDIAGKEKSLYFIVEVLKPNALYCLLIFPIAITITILLLRHTKSYTNQLIIHFVNVYFLCLASTGLVTYFMSSVDMVNGWIYGTLPYWLIGTLFTFYYFLRILNFTTKIEEQLNKNNDLIK
jgi:hypothetical protein